MNLLRFRRTCGLCGQGVAHGLPRDLGIALHTVRTSQPSLPGLKSSIVLAVNEDAPKPTRCLLVARYNIFLLWPIGHHWAYPFMDTGTIMVLPWLLGLLILHGVFFTAPRGMTCPCMRRFSADVDWAKARFMPHLDSQLKAITVAPFDLAKFVRLGQLRAQVARLGW